MRTCSGITTEKNGPDSLRPGPNLVESLAAGERAGLPVWAFTDLGPVPRLKQVAVGPRRRGDYALCTPPEEQINARGRGGFLRPELSVALDSPGPDSFRLLEERPAARAQARYLVAAMLFDVFDWPLEGRAGQPCSQTVACHLTYSGERAARDAVASGRELWRKLAAWPWWPLGYLGHGRGGASLPSNWWTLPYVVANFEAWRDPQAFRSAQDAARRADRMAA